MQASHRTFVICKSMVDLANCLFKTGFLQLTCAEKTREKATRILMWLALNNFQPLQRCIYTLKSIHGDQRVLDSYCTICDRV